MQTTLFPDYFALDETCCLHRAEIVMEKLAEIPLIFLDNQQERNTVLKRLSEAGVNTLAELLTLPRFDVAEWDGVGRFFLHIFDEMRQEVRNNPEQLIEQWLLQRATWTFPITPEPDNPWSLQHYVSPAPYIASTTAENPTNEWDSLIQQVEQTFTHIVLLLKHRHPTQSNSVCYVKDGQAIGIGAGQQSRIHCTRLAGQKADIWWLRQHPKVMNLPFVEKIRRADRDNTIDIYISEDYDDVLADGAWQQFFTERPEPLTREEKKAWMAQNTGVALGSDAFFPFGDNIERAHRSGVAYVAQAGGSVRDDHVIETCDKYGIAMVFTGVRLFHH